LGGVTYPERLQRYYVKPVYPFAAKRAKMSGVVHVRVVVQPDGTVGEVSVVRSSPPGAGFEDSALNAVKRWRFKPALRDGEPVAASILVKVDFL
jgi:protein TonB